MENDPLTWLQDWYEARANGTWEHRHGVRVAALDTPGWSVTVDLGGTALADSPFETLNLDRGERDWLYCWVEEGRFEGRGGPRNLAEILAAFRAFAGA